MWSMILPAQDNGSAPITYTVNISNQSITTEEETTATAGYRLGTDGIAYRGSPGFSAISGEWLSPADATEADLYECRATLVSGTLSSGTTGSWLALTADRTWDLTRNVIGTSTVVLTIEIRLASNPGVILDVATITLNATVF